MRLRPILVLLLLVCIIGADLLLGVGPSRESLPLLIPRHAESCNWPASRYATAVELYIGNLRSPGIIIHGVVVIQVTRINLRAIMRQVVDLCMVRHSGLLKLDL